MEKLHLMSPFEELTELRAVLTMQEIAEVTGVRRETLSRARPDSRFQRRTQKALDDLYTIVNRLQPLLGAGTVHLAAVMRRPQAAFAQRSIADLLQEGEVERVLDLLRPSAVPEIEQLENFRLDPATEAELRGAADETSRDPEPRLSDDRRVADLLASDPELASVLPAAEARIHEIFGKDVRIARSVVTDYEDPEARDHLYLRIRSQFSFDEEIDRLTELFNRHEDLLDSVQDRLTIGNL